MSDHTVPTAELLAKELKVAKWDTLGLHLGVTVNEITEIEQDHPGSTARRRMAMLEKWLKKQDNPSWMNVIEALEKMSERSLAKTLRKRYTAFEEVPKRLSKWNLVRKLIGKIGIAAQQQDATAGMTQLTNTGKLHVLLEVHREDTIAQKIDHLKDQYFELVVKTESDLESTNPSLKDIKRFSQVYMRREVTTIEDLFDQLKPFFFLDCALLEKIIKFLLKQERSVVSKLNDYIRQLEDFKKSTTLQQFMEMIETAQKKSPRTCTVTLQLVGGWMPRTIHDLEKLLEEVFHNKTEVLANLKVVQKCVLVTYIAPSSEATSLIKSAQEKKSFLLKVGVSVLKIGDTEVFSTQSESSDFSFESSLVQAVKGNDIDVVNFLLDINTIPDAADDNGVTGLLWASYLGLTNVANLLLKYKANPNHCQKDNDATPLFVASQNGYSDITCLLIKAKADPNLQKDNGATPLLIASQNGNSDIVRCLLNAKANPNLHRNDGVTPLFLASQNGHSDITSLLLVAAADPDISMDNGATPLFVASQNGHSDVTSILLEANANPNLHRDDCTTPLLAASQNGHFDIVCLLLNADADPNLQRDDGTTPLFMASQNGDSDIVSLLLNAKANPNLRRDDGATPLFMASQSRYYDIVSFFLMSNADPNLCCNDGMTPLLIASQNGHSDIVSLLLNGNANPNLHCNSGVTPLLMASQKGYSVLVSLLLNANANPNHQKGNGATSLFMASQEGYSKIVRLLLNGNANPNLALNNGATPLFVASQNGLSVIVSLLLHANANPNRQTDKGMTPLMAACFNRFPEIVELLLLNGADPDLQNSDNVTALMFAKEVGCLKSTALLAESDGVFAFFSPAHVPEVDPETTNNVSLIPYEDIINLKSK